MKWFKHQSDLSMDERISHYLDEAGRDRLAAYGFLMLLLEVIASRMDAKEGHLVCCATYSIRQWGHIMNSHPNRVRKYLLLCRVVGWVEVEFEEGSCRVSIPRMVEWRDETTRKSRVLPEQVAQSRGEETRKDKRESKDGGSLSNGFAGKDASRSPPHDFEVSLEMRQRAEDERPDIDVDRETKTFLLHTFPTLRSDWESEWMKWIINARPSDLNHQNGKAVTGRKYELISLAKMLQINRNTEESESEFLDRVEKVNQRRIRNLDA